MEAKTNNDNEQKLQQLDENELDQVTSGGEFLMTLMCLRLN